AGATGTLQLDQLATFTGSISGFTGQDHIDLTGVGFGHSTMLAYAPNTGNSGGTLTVSDGTHVANLAFVGQYTTASFAMAGDGRGGTLITDPPIDSAQQSQRLVAGSF